MINDYTLSRPDFSSSDNEWNRSRSISPVVGRKVELTRTRSPSPTRRSAALSQSLDDDDEFLHEPSESLISLSAKKNLDARSNRRSFAIFNPFAVESNVASRFVPTSIPLFTGERSE